MRKTSPTQRGPKPVYLSIVPHTSRTKRDPTDSSRPLITYSAEWVTRKTGTAVYKSKATATPAQATQLALRWLAQQNAQPSMSQNILAAMEWTGPRYINDGGPAYSNESEPAGKKTPAQLEAEIAEALASKP